MPSLDMSGLDARHAIARLVTAMVAADDRLTADEMAAVDRLERLGLGPITPLVEDQLRAGDGAAIDLPAVCAVLRQAGPQAALLAIGALAYVAASDHEITPTERQVYEAAASALGVEAVQADEILRATAAETVAVPVTTAPAAPTTATPPPARVIARRAAARLLGIDPEADDGTIDAAYQATLDCYDLPALKPLGAEFVALAVRRLATLTDAWERLRAR